MRAWRVLFAFLTGILAFLACCGAGVAIIYGFKLWLGGIVVAALSLMIGMGFAIYFGGTVLHLLKRLGPFKEFPAE